MSQLLDEVCNSVLSKIRPNNDQCLKIANLVRKLEKDVSLTAKKLDLDAKVRVEGSVARDTWLSEDPDIDVFMRVSPNIPRSELGKTCLKVARKATEGAVQTERFAEHPYLEAFINGVRVNIVPCYDLEKGKWISATDRTPFHTDYIQEHLALTQHDQVRLLKRFMKGINVYGAEIKIGGFSGYLCELLILHYGDFLNTLRAFANYEHRMIIDMENYYENRREDIDLLFNECLVVIDPVDKGRNVASAVRPQKLFLFIAASRVFLEDPDERFFYPPRFSPPSIQELKREIKDRELSLVAVAFSSITSVSDILWGQLHKSERSLRRLLETNDFHVMRDAICSDEKNTSVFLFELDGQDIASVEKHLGPPLGRKSESSRFLSKYTNNPLVVAGPYVADERWVVELKRKFHDAAALLEERLSDNPKNVGIAEGLAQNLQKSFRILVDDQVAEFCKSKPEFVQFLAKFLKGRPDWLKF